MGISAFGASGIKPGVCTSTTRPSAPYEGMMIYETDTNRVLIWDNAAWVMIADTDAPPGLCLVKTFTVSSSAATHDITSCFTSEFTNYRISVSDMTVSLGSNAFIAYMLSGTTPSTTGYYFNTFYVLNGGSGGLTNGNNSNQTYFEIGSCDTVGKNYFVFDIQAPQKAEYTRFQFSNADNVYYRFGAGVHRVATSYDGFRIATILGGTISAGTVRVYGYRE